MFTTLSSPQSPDTFCVIDSLGCSIADLTISGKRIIWSGTRPDGGKGITHPCIPNFNIAVGLPNHGPARKAEWTKVADNVWRWKMDMIDGVYSAGLEATRQFEFVANSLRVITSVINHSHQDLPINIAEHHYFACAADDRKNVTVNGKPFDANALDGNALYTPLSSDTLEIAIPHLGAVVLQIQGYGAYAQWSQPDAPFICVEPIQIMPPEPETFADRAVKLRVGDEVAFEYILSVK